MVFAGCLACSGGQRPDGAAPSIILITIDAVNTRHLSCYGYERPTTPFLEELSTQGVRFARVWSTCSWTAPAIASLFTGQYSRSHGVRHGLFNSFSRDIILQEPLPQSAHTLAERLQESGYYTMGISTNPHLCKAMAYDQGFDLFQQVVFKTMVDPQEPVTDAMIERIVVDAEATTAATLEMVHQAPDDQPLFLWVHYLDPHWPYLPKEPWLSAYHPTGRWTASGGLYLQDIILQRDPLGIEPGSAILDYLTACYDSELNYCDLGIRELLTSLPEADEAVVIVTADHGESFLEHNALGHRNNLHEEEVHIPLIIRFPDGRRAGETVWDLAGLLDVSATIVELAGSGEDARDQGKSLLPIINGKTTSRSPVVAAELTDFEGFDQVAVSNGRWKLMEVCRDCEPLLFDLISDQHEAFNLAGTKIKALETMKRELADWRTAIPHQSHSGEMREMTLEIKEQLQALGYLKR
ncbi:sulfatase [bacterium]|nr:sulfatase [candidate division CSSED10-310 bacterium]